MDPSKILDWIKLPTKTLTAICLFAGILLFANDELINTIGMNSLIESYRPYIGAIFLISFSLVTVNCILGTFNFFKPWIVQSYLVYHGKKRLKALTPEEKEILSYFIKNQTRSQALQIQDGTVAALQAEKIIARASQLGSLHGFSYIIQPWAWEYLNKNQHLLEI